MFLNTLEHDLFVWSTRLPRLLSVLPFSDSSVNYPSEVESKTGKKPAEREEGRQGKPGAAVSQSLKLH